MTKKINSSNLVKITPSPVPPLRQSLETVMACPKFYGESIIKGNKMPSGMESARGTEIHRVLAEYAAWCATKGVSMDLTAFDRFAKGVGAVAASILSGMRDTYKVQHANLFATEITLSMDEDFHPADVVEALQGTVSDSGKDAAYQGTLDALLFFRDEGKALVDDAKSHPRPFNPDTTLQAKMYALMVFQTFSWVQEVTFRLIFVRFSNVTKLVTYKRQDIPTLIEAVRAARERQKVIHADYDAGKELDAIAGAQCVYCPLLVNAKCPIAQWNPAMQFTPEQRLNFNLWYSAFNKANNKAMKEYVQGTGKEIRLQDFNGKSYLYGPVENESEIFPLFKATATGVAVNAQNILIMPVVDLLNDYAYATPDDIAWLGKIQLSSTSIKPYLKTKKRTVIDQAIDDVVEKVTKIKLAVSKPLDALPDEITDDEQEEEEF